MDKKFKQTLLLVVLGVALYAALMNLKAVTGFFANLIDIAAPMVFGFILAFILNVPMKGYEKLLRKLLALKPIARHIKKINEKALQAVSMALTLVSIVAVVVLISTLVIPELVKSISSVYDLFMQKLPEWLAILRERGIDTTFITNWVSTLDKQKLLETVTGGVGSIMGSVFNIASATFSSVVSIGIGAVIVIYALISKDDLTRQIKRLCTAFLKEETASKVFRISSLLNDTYSKFLASQSFEACILGVLIAIAFNIAGIPYATLIGILTAVCAFIPYVGAFLSCFIGAILVLLTAPQKVILCVVLYLVIQFIENQFIYPHVVGNSVGMSALWTVVAVFVGGKLMGVFGMIFFIPLAGVMQTLLKEETKKRLQKKGEGKTAVKELPSEEQT